MYTGNDIVFGILHACRDGLKSDRLVYYMYVMEKAGFWFSFKYKVGAQGVSCRAINAALNSLITGGKIAVSEGSLEQTAAGELYYDNVILTAAEWDKINAVKSLLDSLTNEELFFVCITDIVVYDTLKRYGADGLITKRATIERTIRNLSSEFTDENFDAALGIMRQVKEPQ